LFLPFGDIFRATVRTLLGNKLNDTFWHVRGLILVFLFDCFFSSKTFRSDIIPVISHILALSTHAENFYFEYLRKLPKTLKVILDLLQFTLTGYITETKDRNPTASHYLAIVRFFWKLREVSSFPSESPLPASAFSNAKFTSLLEFEVYAFEPRSRPLQTYPAILTLLFKNAVFHLRTAAKQYATMTQVLREQLLRGEVRYWMSQDQIARNITFQLNVRRNHLLEDTIEVFERTPPDHFVRKLLVTFHGEEGVDAGGLSREYFHLLMGQLFCPDYGMFKVLNKKYYWFDGALIDDPLLYQTLGTIVAIAVYNNVILPICFPLLFYKKLLRKQITLVDLAEVEPEIVHSFKDMLKMKDKGEDVSASGMTFVVTREVVGTIQEIPLVNGGANIEVTNANVDAYIRAYLEWYTTSSIDVPFQAFRKGFERVFTWEDLKGFTPDELEILVSGEEVLDWRLLEKKGEYADGYTANSRAVRWFWEIFGGLTNKLKKRFLQFTTGSDRAPVGGLGNVIITIQRTGDPRKLPVSHTCFSVLGLPDYPSRAQMAKKLLMALTETEGFGLM
jgi:ubiquitin-protein ligase E3 A